MRGLYLGVLYLGSVGSVLAALFYASAAVTSLGSSTGLYFFLLAIVYLCGVVLFLGKANEAKATYGIEKEVTGLRDELQHANELAIKYQKEMAAQVQKISTGLAAVGTVSAPINKDLTACRLCGAQISRKVAKCPQCQTMQPNVEGLGEVLLPKEPVSAPKLDLSGIPESDKK